MSIDIKIIKKYKCKFRTSSESGAGFTLIEIAVSVLIIALLCAIVISNFPQIKKQFALTQAAYKLAQDLRKTQDMALSGVKINDSSGQQIAAAGYGIYFNLTESATKYLIYADIKPDNGTSDSMYDSDGYDFSNPSLCSASNNPQSDCIIEIIDISKIDSSLSISGISNGISNINVASINFNPPNPTTTIQNIGSGSSQIGITLTNGLTNRTIQVSSSGLINVQ